MAPTLRPYRDVALILPVKGYQYEGIYLLDDGLGRELYRTQPCGKGRLRLSRDNSAYTPQEVNREAFTSALLGMVVGRVEIFDSRVYGALRSWIGARHG